MELFSKLTSADLGPYESSRPYSWFLIWFHIAYITQITLSEKCRLSYGRIMQSFRRDYQVQDVKLKFDDGYQIVSITEQMSSNCVYEWLNIIKLRMLVNKCHQTVCITDQVLWEISVSGRIGVSVKPRSNPEYRESGINTLRPRQNDRHFTDDIFQYIFLNENVVISIEISPMIQLSIFQHWFR